MDEPKMQPLQAMINGWSAQGQRDRAASQMTLGALIEALAALTPERRIVGLVSPHSYRGYYSDLAFEAGESTVADALAEARSCMGEVFEGYKGDDFQMGKMTPIWSAAYGCCGEKIVGLDSTGDPIRLVTKPDEF